MLTTPAGKPTSSVNTLPSKSAVKGVSSEGFATMQLPISKAGATFHDRRYKGKFHGVTNPTIPTGFRTTVFIASAISYVSGFFSLPNLAKNRKFSMDLVASTILASATGLPVSLDSSCAISSFRSSRPTCKWCMAAGGWVGCERAREDTL